MADGDEPIRPRPPVPTKPGQPLPRLWKTEPDPEPEDDKPATDRRSRTAREKAEKAEAEKPKAKSKAKAKREPERKASKGAGPSKGKGVLLEETPELDTYESRQRVRLLVGGLIAAVALLTGFYLLRSLNGPSISDEEIVDLGPVAPDSIAVAAHLTPDKLEQEARVLLDNARTLAKNGKIKESTVILQRIGTSYPKSATAALAKAALDRPARNLPLFLDEEVIVATTTAPKAKTAPTIVNAVDPNATIVAPGSAGNATVHLNPNPAEAPRASSESVAGKAAVAARPLPAGFRMEAESGVHGSGWPYQIVSDRDGAVMVLVPAGTFTQGRDEGSPDEAPAHKVKLGAFYVDQHEVTIRQYDLYLKETGRRRGPPRKEASAPATRGEEDPVTHVTSLDAKAYCEWAGKRLPTEAQWEAAARSTDGRLFPWGGSEPVWSRPRLPRQIDPIGSYPLDQSPYGGLDFAGNAWEWTQDWFDSKYYQQLKGVVTENPTGPASSRARPAMVVVKGGSKNWTIPWREGLKVDAKLPYVGFRGVLPLEQTADGVIAPPPANGQPKAPTPASNGIVPF